MAQFRASTSPVPFSGEDWFDPLEEAIRFRVRSFTEAMVEEEAEAAPGGRKRCQRVGTPRGYPNGHRDRQLLGTFGAVTVSLPRARLFDEDGRKTEWRSGGVQAYKRLTKRAEAIIANAYLAGTHTRRVRRALAGLFGGKVGKDAVSRAWRQAKTDWQARDLPSQHHLRLRQLPWRQRITHRRLRQRGAIPYARQQALKPPNGDILIIYIGRRYFHSDVLLKLID